MVLAVFAFVCGLILLVWSADRFIEGASLTAKYFSLPPLLIGIVIVGFGTSAPEIAVSMIGAIQKNPGIALGNAYGSNIANIGLILGISAIVSPILVNSRVLRIELPILTLVTAIAVFQLADGIISRTDSLVLIGLFSIVLGWSIYQGTRSNDDVLGYEFDKKLRSQATPLRKALLLVILGLVLLVISSRILVWGAIQIAQSLGINDLIIGLTIVAIGTSLPELASSLVAVRRGEHDIVMGNIIGSNLINTMIVVGLAGIIAPMTVEKAILSRDILVMTGFTLSLYMFGYGFRGQGQVNRVEGGVIFIAYLVYAIWLGFSVY